MRAPDGGLDGGLRGQRERSVLAPTLGHLGDAGEKDGDVERAMLALHVADDVDRRVVAADVDRRQALGTQHEADDGPVHGRDLGRPVVGGHRRDVQGAASGQVEIQRVARLETGGA